MMRNDRFLAVDQGNSFFKLTLFSDSRLVEECRIPADSAEDIFGIVERFSPSCGAFCSVGRIDSRIVESLRIALDGNLLILSRSTPLPVSISYATPSTLGLDRMALSAGAASLFLARLSSWSMPALLSLSMWSMPLRRSWAAGYRPGPPAVRCSP